MGNKSLKHSSLKKLVNWFGPADAKVTVNLITNYLSEMQLLVRIITRLNFGLSWQFLEKQVAEVLILGWVT